MYPKRSKSSAYLPHAQQEGNLHQCSMFPCPEAACVRNKSSVLQPGAFALTHILVPSGQAAKQGRGIVVFNSVESAYQGKIYSIAL
jgi:hypothetical protein